MLVNHSAQKLRVKAQGSREARVLPAGSDCLMVEAPRPGKSSGRCRKALARRPMPMSRSVDRGKCGPCCSDGGQRQDNHRIALGEAPLRLRWSRDSPVPDGIPRHGARRYSCAMEAFPAQAAGALNARTNQSRNASMPGTGWSVSGSAPFLNPTPERAEAVPDPHSSHVSARHGWPRPQ